MPRPGYDSVVLLTGLPSLYARKMLEQLLSAEPRALVYAVVPARSSAQAAAQVKALAERAELQGVRNLQDRVVLLEGEVSAMDLGLSGAEVRQLAREVDRIHHVAHTSAVGADRKAATALNVTGTAEVIELGRAAGSLRCLVHHSTAMVAGDRRGAVYEDELDCGQGFRSVIEETRMRAEQIARRAMREVPIAVVRPTTLVGDSVTGEVDRLDGLYLLVVLVIAAPAEIAIPLPGRGDAPLNIVPLDFVVRAAHAIGRDPGAPGRTFHLADAHPLSARRVFELVARASGRRTARSHIPSNVAKALLRAPGIERLMRSPRAFVEQLMTQVRYDTRNADQILAGTDIACPPFESYVDALVRAVEDRLRERRGRRQSEAEAEIEDPLS